MFFRSGKNNYSNEDSSRFNSGRGIKFVKRIIILNFVPAGPYFQQCRFQSLNCGQIRIKKTYEDIRNLHETYFSDADNAFLAVVV
jgi:hypothetical protein